MGGRVGTASGAGEAGSGRGGTGRALPDGGGGAPFAAPGEATFAAAGEPSGAVAGEPTFAAPGEATFGPAGQPVPPNVPVTTPTGWAAPRPIPPVPIQSAGPGPSRAANLPAPVETTAALPVEATAALPVEPTDALPVAATSALTVGSSRVPPARSAHLGPYGVGPTILVALLALATAGAFLPAWDHYVGVVAASGRSISFSLGNAFSGPWPIVLGNVITALALLAIPIAVTRLRDRTIAAAVVVGSLIVLAAQFTSAIVQVDQTVPPSVVGLTPAQQTQLGLQLHLSLTGWFTFDVLAAYALFVAVMVIGYLRPVEAPASAAGAWPTAQDTRRPAGVPWS